MKEFITLPLHHHLRPQTFVVLHHIYFELMLTKFGMNQINTQEVLKGLVYKPHFLLPDGDNDSMLTCMRVCLMMQQGMSFQHFLHKLEIFMSFH